MWQCNKYFLLYSYQQPMKNQLLMKMLVTVIRFRDNVFWWLKDILLCKCEYTIITNSPLSKSSYMKFFLTWMLNSYIDYIQWAINLWNCASLLQTGFLSNKQTSTCHFEIWLSPLVFSLLVFSLLILCEGPKFIFTDDFLQPHNLSLGTLYSTSTATYEDAGSCNTFKTQCLLITEWHIGGNCKVHYYHSQTSL